MVTGLADPGGYGYLFGVAREKGGRMIKPIVVENCAMICPRRLSPPHCRPVAGGGDGNIHESPHGNGGASFGHVGLPVSHQTQTIALQFGLNSGGLGGHCLPHFATAESGDAITASTPSEVTMFPSLSITTSDGMPRRPIALPIIFGSSESNGTDSQGISDFL